jgi:hypothetical protein
MTRPIHRRLPARLARPLCGSPTLPQPSVLALAILILAAGPAASQAPDSAAHSPRGPVWGSIGFGLGQRNLFGMDASLGVRLAERHLLSVRGVALDEFQVCLYGPCTTDPERWLEIGALYGLVVSESSRLRIRLGGGVGVVSTSRDDPAGPDLHTAVTISLPIESALELRLRNQTAVRAGFAVSLNREWTMSALYLGLAFGGWPRTPATGR